VDKKISERPILSMVVDTGTNAVRVRAYADGARYWAELTIGDLHERAVIDALTHDELIRLINTAAAAFSETVTRRHHKK
jgi:hypothetical protein